jgi:iron complex outermembrane receptor protein
MNAQTLLSGDSIADAGTIYRIDATHFPQGITISPEELIQGTIPGLQVTSNSGSPGSEFTITNRGISTLSGYTSPLIIIDGILQLDNQIPLNPADIASIVMVKDASTMATFGYLAGNGALIITTKQGGGKLHINYSGNISISEVTKKADMLSASEFRSLINQQYAGNSSVTGLLGNANTDWQNEIYQPAFGQDHHLSVSGSCKWLPYRLSLGQTNQQGILKTDQYNRTTATLSLTPSFFNNHLKVAFNSFVSFHNNGIANTNAIVNALSFDPTQPVMNGSSYGGYFTWEGLNNVPLLMATYNPVALLNQVHQTEKSNRIEGNLDVDYSLPFLPDLHVAGNYAYDYSGMNYHETNDPDAVWYQQYAPTIISKETDRRQQYNIHMNYAAKIEAIDARLNAVVGYSSIIAKSTGDYSVNIYPADPSSVASAYQSNSQNEHVALMGGFDFMLKNKYSLSANVQKYHDSQFTSDTKPDMTTSEILAWDIKKESFLQHTDWLNDLNLHANYSNVGNINPVSSSSLYAIKNVTGIISVGGLTRPYYLNTKLKREDVVTWSAGMGFGMFNQRIMGTFDVYQHNTNNILTFIPLSFAQAINFYVNDGQLVNKGIELQLSGKPVVTKDLTWTVNYSFSYNQNKRTDSNYPFSMLYGNIIGGIGNDILIIQNNYPVGSFYALRQIYDSNGNPLEGQYATNSQNNFFIEHQIYPTILMGFSSALKYKKWFFNCSLHANIGNYVFNGVDAAWGGLHNTYINTGFLENVSQNALTTKFQNIQPLSDYYIQNASFLRMDNISAGYTFNKLLDTNLSAKLFIAVQNAFIITGYKGQDPEQATGIDQAGYPRARTFSLGLSVDM